MKTLRDYQRAAVAAAFREWDAGHRSTLIVLPTGTGKSLVAAEIARHFYPRRVLWLAGIQRGI